MKWIKYSSFVLIALLSVSVLADGVQNDGNVFRCHSNNGKKIALTFDDGPHPEYTEKILSILEKYGVKATFFVVGENAVKYPELVKREIDGGNEVGNHTMTHANLKNLCGDCIEKEIEGCAEAVYEADEWYPKLIRPPGGNYKENLIDISLKNGLSIVLWNIDTRDWAHTEPEKIIENVTGNIKSGDIVLFHDFISGSSPTPEALESIIPTLIAEGYSMVTVSELLGSK